MFNKIDGEGGEVIVSQASEFAKRLFDVVASAAGILLLSPLLAGLAVLIKLSDGGPVFFRQERVGRGFIPFMIFKFRTMKVGAELFGPKVTSGGDSRITPPGVWLRRLKLDELPQLFNVLAGDMSIVGPRPEVPRYVLEYRSEFADILRVRPGITDYASIKYIREEDILSSAKDPEEAYLKEILPLKLSLNRQYVRDRCFFTDARLIAATLAALFSGGIQKAGMPTASLLKNFFYWFQPLFVELKGLLSRRRGMLGLAAHAAAVSASAALSFKLFYNGDVPLGYERAIPLLTALSLSVRLPMFGVFGLYRGLWRYTGLIDIIRIFGSVSVGSAAMLCMAELWGNYSGHQYPHSIVILDWMLNLGLVSALHIAPRLFSDYRHFSNGAGRKKVLVIGAGNAGEMIVRDMKKSPYQYEPVGFVDDDKGKKGLSIHGVRIHGSMDDIPAIVKKSKPDEILIAIPSASPSSLMRITGQLSEYKLPIKTLPNLKDVFEGNVSQNQIKMLELEDLLARPPIQADMAKLKRFTHGKRVMVTGAGGSIGSEICRQIMNLGASSLIAYERHENSLYNLEMELRSAGSNTVFHPVIGDVNDRHRLEETMHGYRPQIIYHAAAHKHVPMMEVNPREAVYNNIIGTRKTAVLAGECGVETFVLISTDKAVNPTSIMGASKRACELVVRALNENSSTKYITVRFGNVLGSSGSVVPLFREQISKGGPVTVTHPDIERFMMLIPEAVQLVIQAASVGEGGEIFVLDMGEPMKIRELARNMIILSGFQPDKDIKIEYVGLRPGEKLFEELFDKNEQVSFTPDSKVFKAVPKSIPDRAAVINYSYKLEQSIINKDLNGTLRLLCQLVETYNYNPQSDGEEIRKAA